ncbi:MAG TPA: hypothetical protein VFD95_00015 [Usitatibacter sp.]|nr:hypothetical protein [Usitatibacter sp.]
MAFSKVKLAIPWLSVGVPASYALFVHAMHLARAGGPHGDLVEAILVLLEMLVPVALAASGAWCAVKLAGGDRARRSGVATAYFFFMFLLLMVVGMMVGMANGNVDA